MSPNGYLTTSVTVSLGQVLGENWIDMCSRQKKEVHHSCKGQERTRISCMHRTPARELRNTQGSAKVGGLQSTVG